MSFEDEMEETKEERKARRAREKKIKKKILMVVSILVLVVALLIVLFLFLLVKGRMDASNKLYSEADNSVSSFSLIYAGEKTDTTIPQENSSSENVQSSSQNGNTGVPVIDQSGIVSPEALMIRLSDQAVVFDKNGETTIYPASLTKMMTCIIGIEKESDLDKTFMVTDNEIDPAWNEGATVAGFGYGETVTIRDLLYGIMLPSGADACYALADAVAGSEADFVTLMNQKAQELGMTGTNFTNCTGLHDANQYTTCADLAKLLEYCLQNSTFRDIFTSYVYTTTSTDQHPDGITISSRLFTYLTESLLDNGTVIEGGKTGYTDEAGNCLASLAKAKDGTEYILITAGAASQDTDDSDGTVDHPNITDAVYIYGQLP